MSIVLLLIAITYLHLRQFLTIQIHSFPCLDRKSRPRKDRPELWSLDPFSKTKINVHTFSDAYATAGLVEMPPDIRAIVAGKYRTSTNTNTPGS
ncbi:hypothetical protein Ct61P_14211 [Colletotrichum tofieldiae]|nr:hypothetical protein Ct61P_14211 [Colletotrichum tofieldiae]